MIPALLTAILICVVAVLCSLPPECWWMIRRNSSRLDGTISRRRLRRELSALTDYVSTIAVPLLLTFLPLTVTTVFVFSYVLPSEIMFRSLAGFDSDFQAWKENLTEVREDHKRFLQQQSLSESDARTVQRTLWQQWPLLGGTAIVLTAFGIAAFIRCGKRAAVRLASGIRKRRSSYARDDVSDMMADGKITGAVLHSDS